MATLTIRNVDAGVRERLRVRAARHGRSMEAEVRSILSEAVAADRDQLGPNLAEAIRRRPALPAPLRHRAHHLDRHHRRRRQRHAAVIAGRRLARAA